MSLTCPSRITKSISPAQSHSYTSSASVPPPQIPRHICFCLRHTSFAEPLRDAQACFSYTLTDTCTAHSRLLRAWQLTSLTSQQSHNECMHSAISFSHLMPGIWYLLIMSKTTINNHAGIKFLYELGKYLGMQLLHTVKLFLAL